MNVAHARMLFDYTQWANDQMLGVAGRLSPEQFTQDLGSSFPSVRDTLAHMLAAEWVWLERWYGRSPSALPGAAVPASADDLRRRWQEIVRDRDDFLAAQTDDTLAQPLAYANTKGEPFSQILWYQMQHVVNHSTYHRGQVATMIRQLGGKPPTTDLVAYLRAFPPAGPPADRPPAVSFFITASQREELRRQGYTDEAIDVMKPEDAHRILGRR